jgi:hypothetical protein
MPDATAMDSAAPGSDAGPQDAGASSDATDAESDGSYSVCPPGISATFSSILTTMLATSSCGTNRGALCHSAAGAAPTGTGNLLDLSADASAVYEELLGPDGGGAWAANIAGSAHVQRVVPGDASASFLYIKLTLKALVDPQYGQVMPSGYPGAVCPEALDAVKQWIDQGAAAN